MTTPLTKTARHARIADILAREQVRSQEELAELLERYAGVHVTQATLSRDLDELGIVRLRSGGSLVYALPEEPGGPGSHPGGPGPQSGARIAGAESPHDARLVPLPGRTDDLGRSERQPGRAAGPRPGPPSFSPRSSTTRPCRRYSAPVVVMTRSLIVAHYSAVPDVLAVDFLRRANRRR